MTGFARRGCRVAKRIFILWVFGLLASGSIGPRAATAAAAAPELGRLGMVVSTHHAAARAGASILEAGGNAIDAAVATAFAVGVVQPFSAGVGRWGLRAGAARGRHDPRPRCTRDGARRRRRRRCTSIRECRRAPRCTARWRSRCPPSCRECSSCSRSTGRCRSPRSWRRPSISRRTASRSAATTRGWRASCASASRPTTSRRPGGSNSVPSRGPRCAARCSCRRTWPGRFVCSRSGARASSGTARSGGRWSPRCRNGAGS